MKPQLRLVPNPHFETRLSSPHVREVPVKETRRVLTPKTLYRGLARELELLTPAYVKLRVEHDVLAAYPTLASLMDRVTVGPRDDAKKELLASLTAIRQSSPHRLWVAILLRAFRPMLAKLWKELFGADTEERLALLILAFQGALLRVDPRHDPVRIAMYIRQRTRRFVIASLTKEVDWNDVGFGEDAEEVADPRDHELRGHQRAVRKLQGRGALLAHIRREHPSLSPRDQAREYHKLRRRLKRTLDATSAGKEGTR